VAEGVGLVHDDLGSFIEYARQLTLGALHRITRALLASGQARPSGGASAEHDVAASFDADLVIHCVHTTNSTQTRAAALLLLGSAAAMLPRLVLRRLMPVLLAVGATSLAREDSYTLAVVQRLVEAVVPPLRLYGPAEGVTVQVRACGGAALRFSCFAARLHPALPSLPPT
jgi:hypothetical protein